MDTEDQERSEAESEIVEILLEQDHFEDDHVVAVAKKFLAGSELTDPESKTFDAKVAPNFAMTCSRCNGAVPINEIPDALREYDELCSYCRNQEEKIADE